MGTLKFKVFALFQGILMYWLGVDLKNASSTELYFDAAKINSPFIGK